MSIARNLEPTLRHKAWLVDLDGTLYRATYVRMAMAAQLAMGHWRAVPVLRAFRRELEDLRCQEHDCGVSPFQLQIERAAKRLGQPPESVEALVAEWMVRRPGRWLHWFRRRGLLAEIERFRDAGGRTALVSDYPAREKLAALGASHLFEHVIASGDSDGLRRLKPWPDGYLLAAQCLGVEPRDCIVLGDRADTDGEAARSAGMDFRKVGLI